MPARPTKRKARAKRFHHHVYVVQLSDAALRDRDIFALNPQRDPTLPCVYVGMTGLKPDERLANHLAGRKASKFVRKYGVRLLPELYECFNPMPYAAALRMEAELAEDLRARGYTVVGGH